MAYTNIIRNSVRNSVIDHEYAREINPVFGEGELVVIKLPDGTRSFKIGDGATYYNELPFFDYPVKKKHDRALNKVMYIIIATGLIKIFLYFYGSIDFDNLALIYSVMTILEFFLVKWGGRYK